MDNIGMKKDNFTYIKNTNKNEVKYKIFEHLKDEYADRILIFTKTFNYAIEFINFTNHVDKLIIDESNILYTALDTLLCDENILEIPNEDVRVEEDFKLIIKRLGDKIIMHFDNMPKKIVNSILINNKKIKSKMNIFFDVLDNSFTQYNNDPNVYKLSLEKR